MVDRTVPVGTASLQIGVTHGSYSVDPWNNRAAVIRAKRLLAAVAVFQNQSIYGQGAVNPEPAPGNYDWRSLDERIGLIRSMGAQPVITLCCAPDWMTSLGTTTEVFPDLPPTPGHYSAFAELARQIALRYRDVKYFQVWNEMKGMWNPISHNWDYVGYTNLYNAVYDALKGVDPTINVGGPYLAIDGTGDPISRQNMLVIDYWLANMRGADFICFTHSVVDWQAAEVPSPDQILASTNQFERIESQIRQKTVLPFWWSEDYFDGMLSRINYADNAFQAVALASILLHEERGFAFTTLRWQPQGVSAHPYDGNQESWFSDTRFENGGQPFPTFAAYRLFHDLFPAGTELYRATSSLTDVEVMASSTTTLLINKRPTAVQVSLNGTLLSLEPYAVVAV